MCGICGFVGPGSLDDLKQLMKPLLHRGPDAQGTWDNSSNVFIGHTRLSIIDLETGFQPMLSTDGKIVISYNGEIYNLAYLTQLLRKYTQRSFASDTEAILYCYYYIGLECFSLFSGIFALAIFLSTKY